MKLTQYFLIILISIVSIWNLNAEIPCTHTTLKVDPLHGISISRDCRFVVGITLANQYLHQDGFARCSECLNFWDLYSGNKPIINLGVTFDILFPQMITSSSISDVFDDGTILISTQTRRHTSSILEFNSNVKVIRYNLNTKELNSNFYEYQNEDDILEVFIQNYILYIITTNGYLRQIDLITHNEEDVTNLFENLPDAIIYKVKVCKEENLIIIANKYKDTSKRHTVSYWHNNNLINRTNIPSEYKFDGMFSDGSFLLRRQSDHGAGIYNINSKKFPIISYSPNIEILGCDVINDDVGYIAYKERLATFLKLICNQTKENVIFEMPIFHTFLSARISADNKILKIFLLEQGHFKTIMLEICLFNPFNHVINQTIRKNDKSVEMLTGDYQITNGPTDTFKINKVP